MLKYRSLFVFFSGMLRANVTLVSSATNAAAFVDMALTIERTSDTFSEAVSVTLSHDAPRW